MSDEPEDFKRNEWNEIVMVIRLPDESLLESVGTYKSAARYVGWFFAERARLGCDMTFEETMEEFSRNVHAALLAETLLRTGGPH